MDSQNSKTAQRLSTALWVVLLVIAWELVAFFVADNRRNPEYVLPHLGAVAGSVVSGDLVNSSQTALQLVLDNAGLTLLRAGAGFLIGIAIGVVLALLMRLFAPVEKIAFPYLMMIQMIPILGMAPIVLALTKSIDLSRMEIAAILTFYPVATNFLAGLKSVDPERLDLMHSISAGKWDVYTKLLIPSAMPYFFTGLKIAAPMAITASILVDTLQGGGGLGCMLSQSLKHAMSIYVFWQILFLSAFVGILSYYLMSLVERLVSPQIRARGGKA